MANLGAVFLCKFDADAPNWTLFCLLKKKGEWWGFLADRMYASGSG